MTCGCADQPVDPGGGRQGKLLDRMDTQVRSMAESREREALLKTLEQLRSELQQTRAALVNERQEMERLRQKYDRKKLSGNLAVESIEIPFFSPTANPDGLDLWVIPRDAQGDSVKLPGSLVVSLHEQGFLGLGTTEKKIHEWSVPPEKLKDQWAGQLYQGYHVVLPWPKEGRPDFVQVLLRARFIGPDDKSCTTEKVVEFTE